MKVMIMREGRRSSKAKGHEQWREEERRGRERKVSKLKTKKKNKTQKEGKAMLIF